MVVFEDEEIDIARVIHKCVFVVNAMSGPASNNHVIVVEEIQQSCRYLQSFLNGNFWTLETNIGAFAVGQHVEHTRMQNAIFGVLHWLSEIGTGRQTHDDSRCRIHPTCVVIVCVCIYMCVYIYMCVCEYDCEYDCVCACVLCV